MDIREKRHVVGAICIILGMASAAYASWTSPDPAGLTHTNDTTCGSEPKARFCRLCCLHFNPDNTSTAYTTCNGNCPNSNEVPPGEE